MTNLTIIKLKLNNTLLPQPLGSIRLHTQTNPFVIQSPGSQDPGPAQYLQNIRIRWKEGE